MYLFLKIIYILLYRDLKNNQLEGYIPYELLKLRNLQTL